MCPSWPTGVHVTQPEIRFGDATAALVWLLDLSMSVPVSSRVPADRPAEFVTAVRTGGTRRNLVVDSPIILIEAWAAELDRAHDLCAEARAVVDAAVGDYIGAEQLLVCRVDEVAGPAPLPDPLSSQARYTLTLQVSLRAVNA